MAIKESTCLESVRAHPPRPENANGHASVDLVDPRAGSMESSGGAATSLQSVHGRAARGMRCALRRSRRWSVLLIAGASFAMLAVTEPARAQSAQTEEVGLWGLPVERQGFHLQIGFGVGGGPDTSGLFHTMEVGYTFSGHTVALLHTFIQNKGILGTDENEPDLIGGWMVEYKYPLYYPDLVGKIAFGLGGTHEQEGGIKAYPGFGVSYGVDLHLPLHPRVGPTLTLAGMNVTARGQHHFGAGLAAGFTVF